VLVSGAAAYWFDKERTRVDVRSLAIVPFENLAGNTIQATVDGFTQDLATNLGTMAPLRIPPVSMARSKQTDAEEIVREMNTDAVLRGTVSQSQGQFRIEIDSHTHGNEAPLIEEGFQRREIGVGEIGV